MASPLVETTRWDQADGRDVVESVHHGHVVVVGEGGAVRARLGDPEYLTFVRSSVKPLQAATCLRLLGAAAADLTDEELAVAWASHRAEPEQLAAIVRLLDRSGTAPEDLTCPPDRGEADPGPPSRLANNCSGKHALFALAGSGLGCRAECLVDPTGPLQREVLADLDRHVGPIHAIAVDGCGAPVVAVPLIGLARGFWALPDLADAAPLLAAGHKHPGLVGGAGRAETALLAAGVVAKPGAEGVFAATWETPAGERLAAAVKVADGAGRAAAALIVAVVAATGGPPVDWEPPPPLGGGRPAGRVRVVPAVHEVMAAF
jgi:L-asparaginase II